MKQKRRRKKQQQWWIVLISLLCLAAIGAGTYFYLSNNNKSYNDENTIVATNNEYVRPPIGAKFKLKNSDKEFILNVSHFDSPGASSSNNELESSISGQGQQEINEAYNIDKVMDWFKENMKSQNIFFMGDTNIKLNNQNKAFNVLTLQEKGYSFLFNDTKDYASSLSTTYNTFANPYDKVIYSLNDFNIDNDYQDIASYVKPNLANGFMIDTYKTYRKDKTESNWISYENLWNKEGNTDTQNLYNYIKYGVSDNVPVGLDIQDNQNNRVRLGFWNTLNFSLAEETIKSNYDISSNTSIIISKAKKNAHARNIADIIYNANYDLIGFVEINNGTPNSNLQNFINYLNSKNTKSKTNNKIYSGFLTKATNSSIASKGQIEQVAFIYNSNVLELDSTIYPRFYGDTAQAILENKIINNLNNYYINNYSISYTKDS